MESNVVPCTNLGFANTATQHTTWLKMKPCQAGWKQTPVCGTHNRSLGEKNMQQTNSANRRLSRRAVLQSAGALVMIPFLQGCVWKLEAQAAGLNTLDASEGLSLLRTMNVRVDDLQTQAAFGNWDDLRRALRLEPFGRLRIAVAAVSAGNSQNDVVKAAKQVRTAVESADITALRASRGQTSVDDVPPRLEDLRSAIANLITLVDTDQDGMKDGSNSSDSE